MSNNAWTENEILFLKENVGKLSHQQIADALNRPRSGVRNKCYKLKLVFDNKWTDEEVNLLYEYLF